MITFLMCFLTLSLTVITSGLCVEAIVNALKEKEYRLFGRYILIEIICITAAIEIAQR